MWSRGGNVWRVAVVALAFVLALVAAGCSSDDSGGETTSTAGGDTSAAGSDESVSLTMLTVQSGGFLAALQGVVDAFEAENPNVTIDLQNTDSATFNSTIKLIASSDDAPDLMEVGQGNTQMAPLVEAGLLVPLDDYDVTYKWSERFDPSLLDESRAADDGSSWGAGTLYGVPFCGNMIGLYFNRDKVDALGIDPYSFTSIADVTAAFETAKTGGEDTVIMVGLSDQAGDGGEKPWETLASAFQTPEQKYNWIAGQPGANINNPEALAATQQLIDWIDAGYFYDGGPGTTREDAVGKFASGEGVFFISGSWYLPTIKDVAGDAIGYVRMPEAKAGEVPRASGATSQPFGISVKSDYPDVAASFLDFLASDATAQLFFDAGQLPLVGVDSVSTDSQLVKDALAAWETLTQDGVLTLHTDWAAPTTQNLLNPTIQGFYLGQGTPEAFLEAMQADWETFQASKSQ